METTNTSFIESWSNYFVLAAYFCFAVGLLIILFHEIKVMMTTKEKNRYDYVNQHELRFFWYATIALIAGGSLFLTAILAPLVPVENVVKDFVGIFFLAAFAVVSYLTLTSLERILYPRFLENRLRRIRNKPRISSVGNKMRKLSVDEGSVHLEDVDMAEHRGDIHSVEYDVWRDDKTGEKFVEKYLTYQHAEKCEECGFFTMKIHSEEVAKKPSMQDSGLLVEHYRCSFCKHREARQVPIAPLSSNVMVPA
jgi:hypothetical protein